MIRLAQSIRRPLHGARAAAIVRPLSAQAADADSSGDESTKSRPYEEIPLVKGVPILGSLPDFIKSGDRWHTFFEKWRGMGDVIRFRNLDQETVVVYRPDLLRTVMMDDQTAPIRGSMPIWRMYRESRNLPLGIVVLNSADAAPENADKEAEEWKRHRATLNGMLNPTTVASHVSRISSVAMDMTGYLERQLQAKGERALNIEEIRDVTLRFGLEAIATVLLGKRFHNFEPEKASDDVKAFINGTTNMMQTTNKIMFESLPFWRVMETSLRREHYQAWDDIFSLAKVFIRDQHNGVDRIEEDGGTDFLDQLRETTKLSPEETLVMCCELVMAGVDTTAVSGLWAIQRLALHPEIQDELYKDISEAGLADVSIPIGSEHLKQIPMIKHILSECFRLDSPVPINGRVMSKDTVLDGYMIPKGTMVMAANRILAKDDANFEDAASFCPHRFKDRRSLTKFAEGTFGYGARQCPGKRIAEMELQVALIQLVRNYRFTSNQDTVPKDTMRLLRSPRLDEPHLVTFSPRH